MVVHNLKFGQCGVAGHWLFYFGRWHFSAASFGFALWCWTAWKWKGQKERSEQSTDHNEHGGITIFLKLLIFFFSQGAHWVLIVLRKCLGPFGPSNARVEGDYNLFVSTLYTHRLPVQQLQHTVPKTSRAVGVEAGPTTHPDHEWPFGPTVTQFYQW